jgi:hypothetical protein
MKEEKVSKVLYPDFFNSDYIIAYSEVNEELKELIGLSGYKEEFTRKFRRTLIMLENLKRNCIKQKSFERLIKNGDIYSIRLIGKKNIRILFMFTYDCGREVVVLLYAFEEKDNKSKSKYSYNSAIEIAKDRINKILE